MSLNTHSLDLESGSTQYARKAYSAGVWEGTGGGNGTEADYGNLTVELWFKAESLPADTKLMNFAQEFTNDAKFYFDLRNDAGVYKIRLGGDFIGGTANWYSVSNNVSISAGTWYHVAGVWDSTAQTMKTLFSGDATWGANSTANNNTAFVDVGTNFTLGAGNDASNPFDGLIDDFRLWNVSRTEAQIEDNRSTELTGSETGLTAYWKLNNDYTDSEVGGYSGLTAYNSPVFSVDVPFAGAVATAVMPVAEFIFWEEE